jgi:hypothetical protein
MTNDRIHDMNDPADEDRRFERLVDGELPPEEYRALLASLDDEPGGWRRCGLAFLEAQALAAELGGIRRGVDVSDSHSGGLLVLPQGIKRGDLTMLVAIAASFLVAFALGILSPRFFSSAWQEAPLAGNLNTQTPHELNERVRDDGDIPYRTLRPVGNLRLVMDGAAGEQPAEAGQVPVYEVGQEGQRLFSAGQPALGPDVIELLRQRGYEVRHEQQYFPAPLDDGRQIIVPVDEYEIRPVGRRY